MENSYSKPHRLILLAFLVLVGVVVSPLSAYMLGEVNISPSYNVLPGDPVTVSFTLTPTPFDMYTSNPNNTIQIITGLDNAVWTRSTFLDGEMSSQTITGSTLTLPGWDIAYRQAAGEISYEHFNITVDGKAPPVLLTGQVTILNIAEFDQMGRKIPTSEQVFFKLVISPDDLQSGIFLAGKDLEILRKNIDEKKKIGIDTSGEETAYGNAVNGLNLVKNFPQNQYPLALERLKEVNAGIKHAENQLDRGWAQFEINNATIPLQELDQVISWFGNRTGFSLINITQQLGMITANRTRAFALITGANNAITNQDYTQARIQAAKGHALADITYKDAIALQKRASDPLTLLWENWIIIVIIILGVLAYLLFKPKKKRKKKIEKVENEETKTE